MLLPDSAADVQAAGPRQHDVQHRQVQPLPLHDFHGLRPVIAFDHLEALVLQIQRHQVRDLLFIVRHQYHFAHPYPPNFSRQVFLYFLIKSMRLD